jgi:hypothetical protein
MSELHLSQYDDEPFFTIDAYDSEAVNLLKALDAAHIRDNLYRLPIHQVVTFLARRFKLDVVNHTHRQISEAQRAARRKSLAQARAQRWAKTER